MRSSLLMRRRQKMMLLECLDAFEHRLFLPLDGFDQFELGAAAVEVVVGTVDAEIGVAAEEIGQETEADLEGDELAGERR